MKDLFGPIGPQPRSFGMSQNTGADMSAKETKSQMPEFRGEDRECETHAEVMERNHGPCWAHIGLEDRPGDG